MTLPLSVSTKLIASTMAYEEDTDKVYSTFLKYDEFTGLQTKLLSVDLFVDPTADENSAERQVLQKLCLIVRALVHVHALRWFLMHPGWYWVS